MNVWKGEKLNISIFGESHGKAVGCVVDGFESGIALDYEYIRQELYLRKPSHDTYSTQRQETDEFEILSGVTNGKTNGSPLCVVFKNHDADSSTYSTNVPRPAHADFAAYVKYSGNCDLRGGGHFSARLTVALVFVGAICKNELRKRSIQCAVSISSVGQYAAKSFYDVDISDALMQKLDVRLPIIDDSDKAGIQCEIEAAKAAHDSVGGCVECCITNPPIGLGEPFFDSVESSIARLAFSIPAVKGIEFGRGFELAKMRGSDANDEYNADAVKKYLADKNNSLKIAYNNSAGGIIGGLTNSMPLLFTVAFKPIPSIGQDQRSVDMQSFEPVNVRTEGRHDVCAAMRGAFVVRSIACICIYDFILGATK